MFYQLTFINADDGTAYKQFDFKACPGTDPNTIAREQTRAWCAANGYEYGEEIVYELRQLYWEPSTYRVF